MTAAEYPVVTGEYPLVTLKEFPDGVRCVRCDRDIPESTPFQLVWTGFVDDVPLTELVCVYCEATS